MIERHIIKYSLYVKMQSVPDKSLGDIQTLKCFLPSKNESVFMIREDGSYYFIYFVY